MNSATVFKGCLPIWTDFVWLARRDKSRFFLAIEEFVRAVEAVERALTLEQIDEFKRKVRGEMRLARWKRVAYSFLLLRAKRDKYAHRINGDLRMIRDAEIFVSVSMLRRGELLLIMDRHGSDKGSGRHNFTLFYEMLFREERENFERIFEVGIGSNDPKVPSNMGVRGIPGASLRGWREYFPNASIFGGDIDKKILLDEDRTTTGFVDQTRSESVAQIFETFGDGFDLIIDDGLHTYEANKTFFESAFGRLRDGGIFVIEDLMVSEKEKYKSFLKNYDSAIFEIPHYLNNDGDNCMAIIVKG